MSQVKGRVLAENDWSMAVKDAFMKACLNQKADFAMIPKFKQDVLDKTIKESPKALKVLRSIKQAMDENRWDDADKALSALETALNPS